jgi:hypothetical protein
LLGITQYFYEAGRLFFPPLFITLLLLMLVFRYQGKRPRLKAVALSLITAMVIAAPFYLTTTTVEASRTLRLDVTGITFEEWQAHLQNLPSGDQDSIWQFVTPFALIIQTPDGSVYYGGETPFIPMYIALPFLVGVGFLLWHWRRPALIILVGWLVATALANSFMTSNDFSSRYVVLYPILPIMVAVGGCVMLRLLQVPRQIALPLFLVCVLVVGGYQWMYYTQDHVATLQAQFQGPVPDAEDAVVRTMDLPPRTVSYIIDNYADRSLPTVPMVVYLEVRDRPIHLRNAQDATDQWLQSLPRDVPIAFFIDPDADPFLLGRITSYFALAPPQYSPYNIPRENQLVLYLAFPSE